MSEFLAPLNADRARDVLRRLSLYTEYTEAGAQMVENILRECYPLVFSKMEVKTFERGALLLEMGGANVTDPLVFCSHLDVPAGTSPPPCASLHEQPMTVPLSRAHVAALLEALEELLRDGYRPGGDLFLALSMDGLSGAEGAKSIAAHLKARSVSPCFVLDHGGFATMGAFRTYLPKNTPLALIGIAERGVLQGSVTADESVRSRKGHERTKPLDVLLRCGARLSRHPRKAALCDATTQMLRAVGKNAPLPQRLLTCRPRLTMPLLRLLWRKRAIYEQFFLSQLSVYAVEGQGTPESPAAQASLRFQQTVIPGRKNAAYRHRMRRMLHNADLKLAFNIDEDASAHSVSEGEAWDALETAIEIQFERATIVPCLSPFMTDARFFAPLCPRVYRFSPFLSGGEEVRLGQCTVTDGSLQTAVQFFRSMLSV